MKTNSVPTGRTSLVLIPLGILAALLVFAVLTDKQLPLLNNDRTDILALVAIGMVMCSHGIGRVAASQAWLHLLAMIAYLLGAVCLVIGIIALFGVHIPPLTSYYQSFLAVAVIAVFKIIITGIHHLLP